MESQPKLGKPGAGLPLIEGLVARFYFYPSSMRRFSWDGSLRQMRDEAERIAALVAPLTEEQFQKPVLIDRLIGLEDSSRFWSAAMTIEHLMIVIRGMAAAALELASGRPYEMTFGTAAVKPQGRNLPPRDALVADFRRLTEETAAALAPLGAAASGRYKAKHPFFGMIPAQGWVFVLGAHQKLHRVQIERIIKGL